jgi:hypothetical protein
MKFLFFLTLFFLSFTTTANTTVLSGAIQDIKTEASIGNDRGRKARRAKRKNRRRKRKCKQFGRRVHAG